MSEPSCKNVLPYIQPGWVGVEIGVQWGVSALTFLQHGCFMYLTDPWVCYDGYGIPGSELDLIEEDNFKQCRGRLAPYDDGKHFAILRMHSEQAVRFIPDNLDFVWIDGNHGYRWVKKDIELYWPKIKPGGLLCGHDYGNDPDFDVNRAVNEFAASRELLTFANMCWAIWKP